MTSTQPLPPLKLTYFDTPGLAFATRAALRHAKIPLTDARVDSKALAALRGPDGFNSRVPLGTLPVLEFPDGRVVPQSAALARWAGKRANLWPTSDVDELVCDSLMETANEMGTKIPRNPDAAELKRLRLEFVKEKGELDKYLGAIQAAVRGPFILGDDITVADLYVHQAVHGLTTGNIDHVPTDLVAKRFPKLLAFRDAVRAHPVAKAEIDAEAGRAKA